jgi:regulator of sirC expression with transglutaminase-like and TPR domain
MDAREHFARLIELPDPAIPLAEAALWIAAEGRPEADVPAALGELDRLVESASAAVTGARRLSEQVVRLNHFLFIEERFTGNREQYDDPRNSYLDVVLERRLGIPITLSVVYLDVARRLGLAAAGIGFPGHFLAKVSAAEGEIVVDPFYGSVLDEDDCAERLRQVAGADARLDPAMLESTTHAAILRRILGNLKHLHVSRSEFDAALRCSERILLISPDDPIERRDRGLIYRELECFGPALEDLDHFLTAVPDHPTAQAVLALRQELGARVRHIH